MKLAVVVALVAVLLKDAIGASAEGNSLPVLRKYTRSKENASAGTESRGFFSFSKTTKRPKKANIIFVTSPTGTTSSEEEPEDPSSYESAPSAPSAPSTPSTPSWPSWPSWPYWPSHSQQSPTTTTTPKPTTRPRPPVPQYPHYLPFLPPLLVPVPGWTGPPPPPYIPSKYPHRPRPPQPQAPSPPFIDLIPSSPGTPTYAADETINSAPIGAQDNEGSDDLLVFPVPSDFNVNAPNKVNAIKLTPEIMAALTGANRRPQPVKKQKPVRRRTTTTETPVTAGNNSNRIPRPPKRRTPIKKPTTKRPIIVQVPQKQLGNRKKPKPSRKPRPKPTQKPTQVAEVPVVAEVPIVAEVPNVLEVSTAEEVSNASLNRKKPTPTRKFRPKPTTKAPTSIEEDMDDGSGESDVEKQVQPAPKPEPTGADEPETSEQSPASLQVTSDMETVAAAKPDPEDDDLTSEELLGPEKDLIVVEREGKPLETQEAEAAQIPPWQLLKLPRDAEWERGPEERSNRPRYVFYG